MVFILNIETSTKNCSVSISRDGETIACREITEIGFSHAEKLHVFFEEVLQQCNLTFQQLNAVAVSQGPGSYTGLRIGISSAKGLCYSLDIPLIAVDTLEILAKKLTIDNGFIVPMIDARRMECYTAIFDKNHQQTRAVQAEIIDENSFQDIQEIFHLIGDGAEKCKSILVDKKFIFHDDILFPSANEMSCITFDKYKKSDTVDVAYFEPFYLKDFMMSVSTK